MTYNRFEDVPVWKDAVEFVVAANRFAKVSPLKFDRDYTSQWRRTALSISNNIAEGFESGTTEQLLTFLYIARGSAGECRSMTYVFERLSEYVNFKFEISNLQSRAEALSRQLRAWAGQLQNSDIKGQRRLTDQERRIQHQQKDREEFMRYIDTVVADGHRKEKEASLSNRKSQM